MRTIRLIDYELADTALKRALGIMFRGRVERPMLFVFPYPGRISIHSFFCPEFDAVFLDERKRVTEMYENIRAGRLITPKQMAAYLIEFPPNTVSKNGIRKGRTVSFGH